MEQDPKMIDDHKYPLVMFANEMFKELEKHDTEKDIKFYSMSVQKLFELLHDQTDLRIDKIRNTIFRKDMPLLEIEKNCLHLANFCYFLWSQSRKMREDNP